MNEKGIVGESPMHLQTPKNGVNGVKGQRISFNQRNDG